MTYYILHVTYYILPIYNILNFANYILHITYYILHLTYYKLHVTYYILHLSYQKIHITYDIEITDLQFHGDFFHHIVGSHLSPGAASATGLSVATAAADGLWPPWSPEWSARVQAPGASVVQWLG